MADLSGLRTRVRTRAISAVSQSSQTLRQRLQSTSPRRSNRMVLNTNLTSNGLTATVAIKTPYASFVREGTRSGYPIRPKKGKFLAFYWPGDNRRVKRQLPDGRALVKSVIHPGIKANPWYDNAIRQWPDMLKEALRRAN